MNKRYMDFVPANRANEVRKQVILKKNTKKSVEGEVRQEQNKPRRTIVLEQKTVQPKKEKRLVVEPELGVVEDLSGSFKNEVSFNKGEYFSGGDELKRIKAKKIGVKQASEPKEKVSGTKNIETFETPRARFINQDKVVKRPLSKNVYQKRIEVPKEELKGPITIITKPEKQTRISLIVTIILTVILGAVAGTVAFLILPK